MRRTRTSIAQTPRRIVQQAALVVALFLASPAAWADGGELRGSEASGPFVLSLYTSPIPLRPGISEITTLITERESGTPVLDASVKVELEVEDSAESRLVQEAKLGGDGLRYFITPDLPRSGNWKIRVEARNADGEGVLVLTVPVLESLPIALTVWPALAFPPLAIALFALNQRLRTRMPRAKRESRPPRPGT